MDSALTLPVAQLQFDEICAFNFARVVSDLHAILSTSSTEVVTTIWDADDLAQLTIGHLRLFLICGESKTPVPASHLTMVVALADGSAEGDAVASGRRLKSIADLLVAQVSDRFLPVAVLWDQIEGAVTAETAEFKAVQMFQFAMIRASAPETVVPGLRHPVSETEVQSFFGRMPQIAARRDKRASMPVLAAPVPEPRRGQSVLRATVLLVWLPFSTSLYVNSAIDGGNSAAWTQGQAGTTQALARIHPPAP